MTTAHQHLLTLATAAVLMLATACKKEEAATPAPVPGPVTTTTTLLIEHHVDDAPLIYDSVLYTNAMGHTYSVTRLEYYLSEITLQGTNGTSDLVLPGPFYINGSASGAFDLGDIPSGEFSGATALLGLPATLNVTDALPNTAANINMAWPVPMGGGYHFMKFEGHFMNNGTSSGYAMHLGRNDNLPVCTMVDPFTVERGGSIVLRFNLNQVFREPHTYDLSTGNYSMGSMMLMGQLRDNCTNAFNINYRP